MSKKIQNNNKAFLDSLDYVYIFFLIYLSSAFSIATYSGTLVLLLLLCVGAIAFIVRSIRKIDIKVNSKSIIVLVFLCLFVLLSGLKNQEEIKQIFITLGSFFVAYLFSLCFKTKDFIHKYVNVMIFLCVFSLIVWALFCIVPQLFQVFPVTSSGGRVKAYDLFFSTIYEINGEVRNQSLFWEPGAFQTYINLALIFNLFYVKKKINIRTILFGITIFTTFSTTGYIAFILIVFIYLLELYADSKENLNNSRLKTFLVIFGIVVIGCIIINASDSQLINQVFGKITAYKKYESMGLEIKTSTSARIDSFFNPLSWFLQHPLLGIGTIQMIKRSIVSGTGGMNTCTFVNWFAAYGVFVGTIFIYSFYKLTAILSSKKWIRFLLFVVFFIITASENYIKNPSILIFAFLYYNSLCQFQDEKLGGKDA